jgi:UDP-N-acetylmuramoyl-L-alanyl-D-glutamate--2,6-diaminopimelate ligase
MFDLKNVIKKNLPKPLINLRHLFFAWWGSVIYRNPSEEIFVIGITGTSGKSSTAYFLRQILESAGITVGSLSTIDFYIAGKNQLNDQKMTMLGRMQIQKYLRQMVDAGCQIAIVETTSEGAVQYRHRFINYDTIILTNLYPEHIESHGSFENYKKAKLSIFEYVANQKLKKKSFGLNIADKQNDKILKTAIVNGNCEYVNEFLNFPFGKKITFSSSDSLPSTVYGEHNAQNIAAAATAARLVGVSEELIRNAALKLQNPPGRIEFIKEAEKYGFKVIVDYAFEPVAIAALYATVRNIPHQRIIHVFGSTGGGRDKSRRSTVGQFVGENANICIVTDEDPYDEDPVAIMADVSSALRRTGKHDGVDLFEIKDRREAIRKAIDVAESGDIVLVTGKGSEQGMVVNGKILPWDDRKIVREFLISYEGKKQ